MPFAHMFASAESGSDVYDAWVTRMRHLPTTVISTTGPSSVGWPDASVVNGDALDAVTQLKTDSDTPLRSHGSIIMNMALVHAGLVDEIQVTIFPVLSGRTGVKPIFSGAEDFNLELIESQTFDGHIQELTYRPSRHG